MHGVARVVLSALDGTSAKTRKRGSDADFDLVDLVPAQTFPLHVLQHMAEAF